jgi:hypothetical protein
MLAEKRGKIAQSATKALMNVPDYKKEGLNFTPVKKIL